MEHDDEDKILLGEAETVPGHRAESPAESDRDFWIWMMVGGTRAYGPFLTRKRAEEDAARYSDLYPVAAAGVTVLPIVVPRRELQLVRERVLEQQREEVSPQKEKAMAKYSTMATALRAKIFTLRDVMKQQGLCQEAAEEALAALVQEKLLREKYDVYAVDEIAARECLEYAALFPRDEEERQMDKIRRVLL